MNAFLRRFAAVVVCAALVVLIAGTAADAAQQVVTNCANETDLRTKLALLQTGRGGTLTFDCAQNPPPILLTGGVLALHKKVTIDAGFNVIEISGDNASPIFSIDSGAKVTLRGLTLSHGLNSTGDGGAIINNGKLTVDHCTLTQNRSTAASGGAILTYGRLKVLYSELSFNSAQNGGAIYPRFAAAQTTIVSSKLHDNNTTNTTDGWGGAILIWDGASVEISASEVFANQAQSGGAVYVFGAASKLDSTNTSWHDNLATPGTGGAIYNQGFADHHDDQFNVNGGNVYGGAIDNEGMLIADNTGFDSNHAGLAGGQIYNVGTALVGEAAITNGYLGLSSSDGGGIYNKGKVDLAEVTLSGNRAGRGGALSNAELPAAQATLQHVTIYDNGATQSGGGIAYPMGTVTVQNSIVAGSRHGGDCDNGGSATSTLTSQGFNLSGDASCSFSEPTDFQNTDPNLGPLALNGGPTLTHVPRPPSKAIDNGSADGGDIDQRWAKRPQGAGTDIGAVEVCAAGKPGPVELLSPAPKGKLVRGTLLDWSDASCVTSYEVTLRTGSSTGPIFSQTNTSASALIIDDIFTLPQQFAWQVTACQRQRCLSSEWRIFKFRLR